ncbi:MAG TPA: outer membrane beta-barrel protein [Alphaproteobacteria bacterium]|jgi:opacity protein-like surface antigen
MKINIAAIAVGASLAALIATSAQAQESNNRYLRIDSGYSFSRDAGGDLDTDVDNSYIVGVGAGYRFNSNIRADLTVGYRGGYEAKDTLTSGTFTVDAEGDVSSLAGLLNLYYDIGKYGVFTPYVGGGIGLSRNKIDDVAISSGGVGLGQIDGDDRISFAWQLSAGTSIELSKAVSLDIGYRYIDLGKAETSDNGNAGGTPITGLHQEGDLRAHEVQVGIRFAL